MNLQLIDPWQLSLDSPESLTHDLRSGHATTLRFSRKGDYLASGRVDGKIVIWDMETMGVAMKLSGHWKQIQSLSIVPEYHLTWKSWSRDGRFLLSASQDCRACLWDLKTQQRIRTAKFEAPIYLAELHPYNHNWFVVSLFEDHPYLVDTTDPIPIKHRIPTKPLDADTDVKQQTTTAVFSIMGNHIIAGTSKGYINIIETDSRKIVHSTKLSAGLISLIRLTTNGRQMLVNSTDRIIRVIEMPDLSLIKPHQDHQPNGDANGGHGAEDEEVDPSTLAENIHLHTSHKFQDLVNRLRWNDCAFSHTGDTTSNNPLDHGHGTTGFATADYVTASTYMKRDIYIWELRTNSLLRILENAQEPAIIEWHPTRPLLACTSIETGSIQIWGIEPQQKWSALAPDFTEVTENVNYVEREDEFDTYPAEEHKKRRLAGEDEDVDVLTVDRRPGEEESFVLPMLYDIEDSEVDDQELVRMGVGTMRKKEVNEGKEYEDDGEGTPRMDAAAMATAGNGKKTKKK